MTQLLRLLVTAALVFPMLRGPSAPPHSGEQIPAPAASAADKTIFLPIVYGLPSPAGTYDCSEYEGGLIWTSEVVTLNTDGRSVYTYHPPHPSVVTGTWVYTPTTAEIGFTNFRWLTATAQLPNRLWASKYLPNVGFEVALSCSKR